MEKKIFKIIKNILIPIKTTIEIGPEGISYKGKFTKWENIVGFSCRLEIINGAKNYTIAYDDSSGKGYIINFIVSLMGSKKKKQMFAEIYEMALIGFEEHLVKPKVVGLLNEIELGKELELEKAQLSREGISITKGMMKKEKIFIPIEDVMLNYPEGTGGFRVISKKNSKDFQHFPYGGADSRYLLAILQNLVKEQKDEGLNSVPD